MQLMFNGHLLSCKTSYKLNSKKAQMATNQRNIKTNDEKLYSKIEKNKKKKKKNASYLKTCIIAI